MSAAFPQTELIIDSFYIDGALSCLASWEMSKKLSVWSGKNLKLMTPNPVWHECDIKDFKDGTNKRI